LSVHGGPHNYFGETWNLDHQLWAGYGFIVVYANPRGSGGYGERFASDVIGDWGGKDWQDQLAVLDDVLAGPPVPVDATRQAITGSSYGGFMSCWAIGQTDRFAVAVAGACISNLVSFAGTSDIGATWAARELGGSPDENAEWYRANSPLTHAAQVKTPLLLYHGEDDLRCPIEQSEQMFTALHRLGKPVAFLRLPGESHSALNGTPVHRVDARRAIFDWFDEHLGARTLT
jgi:dipeptidyl aminopeptidase/acylaminoacyl peptidase